jgi:hypothetical protein
MSCTILGIVIIIIINYYGAIKQRSNEYIHTHIILNNIFFFRGMEKRGKTKKQKNKKDTPKNSGEGVEE